MATYIIGDVQGCFSELQALLEHIRFNPQTDRLGFTGDLVNRGPDSLKTLRFIKNLKDPIVVLGNHDLYLLALNYGFVRKKENSTLDEILAAPDKEELLTWLRHQPLVHIDHQLKYLLVHAGIPPQWNEQQALEHSEEVTDSLHSNQFNSFIGFLENMYGNQPTQWNEDFTGWDRLRYITNVFTRLRFCDANGELDLKSKLKRPLNPQQFKPWFEFINPEYDILFGHWAALEGKCNHPKCYALDTGCVWGKSLTALRIEDKKLFSVPSILQDKN